LDEDNNILNFIPKKAFNYQEKDRYYKTVNIYKFSADFSSGKYVPFLEAYCKALGNNDYYEQVLRVISLLDNPNLKTLPVTDEKWYEIDDVQDLNNAEALFAAEEDAPHLYGKRYGGYWRFPLMADFCYLVNPYFPNEKMMEEMLSNFSILLTAYPSGMEINSQLAARFANVYPEQIAVGNGAAELINAFLRFNDVRTGIILPTFEEYSNRLSPDNKIAYTPGNKDFAYKAADLITYFGDKDIRQLILINPDNPSGNMLSENEVFTLVEWTNKRQITFIIDESFADFADDGKRCTFFKPDFLSVYRHVVVIKSISKSYGVPGLRLGFLASGDKALIENIKQAVSIWNINSFAEFFMQIFVKYQESYKQACRLFFKERKRFYARLITVSFLRVIPSSASYFLCEITAKYSAEDLCCQLLHRYNILIKDCTNKTGAAYIRLAIRDKQGNNALVDALLQLDT
jgi:histidinol-phosphate/aromatic aminotransferase/cobyric acid decarboxylase-like protein